MQEEVENKTVHLAIQTGKVTVKTLLRGLHAWYRHHQRKKDVAKMSGDSVKGNAQHRFPPFFELFVSNERMNLFVLAFFF